MTFNEELKEYGLHAEWSEADDREPIDFEIRDDHDELYATVWGSNPLNDVDIDCDHCEPIYDDDETVGECPICGATCDWHYENDGEGHKERVPHEWYKAKQIGGIVGRYINYLRKEW